MIGFAEGNLLQFAHSLKHEVKIMESPIFAELHGRHIDKISFETVSMPKSEYEALIKIKKMIEAFDAADSYQHWRDVK